MFLKGVYVYMCMYIYIYIYIYMYMCMHFFLQVSGRTVLLGALARQLFICNRKLR